MLEIIDCPRCGAPAELTERSWLDSTDGPIQHLQTICVSKHWLTPAGRQGPPAGGCHPSTTSRHCQAARPRRRRRCAPAPQLTGPEGVMPMCLRCGVLDRPYRSWPSGPAGPGDYGSPPDLSPPEYGAAPTGGVFGIGAPGRDYRMTTGRWDRGRAIGGNILTRLRVIR